MSKHFVTVIPHGENLELRKDPGQLPYHFGKLKSVNGTLVTYYYTLTGGRGAGPLAIPPADVEQQYLDYPYLLTEVKGLDIHFLPYTGRCKFYDRGIVSYIRAHAKKIDVFNLFHFGSENMFYTLVYKLSNPRGKVYLKLDIDIPFYKNTGYFFNAKGGANRFKIIVFENIIQPLFFKLVHTISAESQKGIDYFSRRFNVSSKKMTLVPNGVDADQISRYMPKIRDFAGKENILITVGKIGTSQKNNEMLLAALSMTDLHDWKVYFIGSIEPAFQQIIDAFFEINPQKRDQVVFTGHINSPEILYGYYDRAKVFCLTSRDEGFPLSACEAAYFGNYMILSDAIDCFDELTDTGKNGTKVELNNTAELAHALSGIFTGPDFLADRYQPIKNYALANLTWQAIVPKLHDRLFLN